MMLEVIALPLSTRVSSRDSAPLILLLSQCTKNGSFQWTVEVQKSLDLINKKITDAPILALQDFENVNCDASGVGIGWVFSQEVRPIAFFSEKLNFIRRRYSTYDMGLCAIVRDLDQWIHYLLHKEFILTMKP